MPNTVQQVGLGGINVTVERLRALRDDTVKSLMESMSANGLLQPIVLRPRGTAGYWLVAGRHRFEAARKLKWESIAATIFDGMDAEHAELAEIDENLIRADLTPIERGLHTARRKELYEAKHPETKQGGDRKSKRQNVDLKDAFTKDTAAKTGKTRRTVERDVSRGKLDGIADAIGTSLDQGDEIDALMGLPEDDRASLIARAKAGEKVSAKTIFKQIARALREAELAGKQAALPEKKYGVVLEDFEWDHKTWSEAGKDRHAGNHYPTSTDAHAAEEIVARTKNRFECAADDCVLFMWTTVPHMAIAFEVMKLRGFTYKSHLVWDKEVIGTGYWFRNRHEILLLGTRGSIPAPAPGEQFGSVINEKRREHSVKPEQSFRIIESYFPNTPKIELNCRGAPRPGWDAWGNEVEDAA